MDHPVLNTGANDNNISGDIQFAPEIGDKNDNLSMGANVYVSDKSASFGDQHQISPVNIDLNYEKQITEQNVQYIQQENPIVSDGNYLVQSTSGYCLVTTENTIITTAADENVYTSAQTQSLRIGYEPQSHIVTTEANYTEEQLIINDTQYISNENIDQDSFVSQYIQEAQAGSQYQITTTDNYLLPAGQGEAVQTNVHEVQHVTGDYQSPVTNESEYTSPPIQSKEELPENGHTIENTLKHETENITVTEPELVDNQSHAVLRDSETIYDQQDSSVMKHEEIIEQMPVIADSHVEHVQEIIEHNISNETSVDQRLVEEIPHDQMITMEEPIKSNNNDNSILTEEISNDSQNAEVTNDSSTKEQTNESIYEHYVTEESIVDDPNSSSQNSSKENEIIEMETMENFEIPEGVEVTTVTPEELEELEGKMVQVATTENNEVVLIQCYEGSETSLDEDSNLVEDESNKNEPVKTTSRQKIMKGRRVTTGDHQAVPPHVLGVDMQTPIDPVNGKKPRLGVKVPCKNLQSQIISKDELQKEIMSRCRVNPTNFAKSLTSRLAKKLGGGNPSKSKEDAKNNKPSSDSSDLLAILEGSDSSQDESKLDTPPAEVDTSQAAEDEETLKQLEKEIAIQQLQEFPLWSPKMRVISKGNMAVKPQDHKPKTSTPIKKQTSEVNTKPDHLSPVKSELIDKASPKKEEKTRIEIDETVEPESQVKVNMVLKTYSRKRKVSETESKEEQETPVKKIAASKVENKAPVTEKVSKPETPRTPSGDAYVTKSSRIIKKKVIWDPAEPTPKKQKIEPPKPTKVEKKTEKKDDNKSAKKDDNKTVEKVRKEDTKTTEKVKKEQEKKNERLPEKSLNNSNEKKVSPKKVKPRDYKKRLTEVEKLLMDEGALNMLVDMKNSEDGSEKKAKHVLIPAKANKEMIKKANEIKTEFQQTTDTDSKSLRKKEIVPSPSPPKPQLPEQIPKKKSKDVRNSVNTPPASPAFSFQESSRLIRRRSSSSISSDSEIDSDEELLSRKRKTSITENSKPKKEKKSLTKDAAVEKITTETHTESKTNLKSSEDKSNQYKSFTFKKSNKLVSLNLVFVDDNCHYTIEVLKELTQVLNQISKDKDCNVVSITASGKSFCSGLNYRSLVTENRDARKKKAQELAGYVKDFLKCLLNFPKVLVAGIEGDCVGLGVTMLPLFDIVIASDSATFSTSYSKLGCVAEGGFLLAPPFLSNRGLASELLYTSNKIKADDATRRGLITRVCWPEKYQDELKSLLGSIAKGSRQSLQSNKKQLLAYVHESAEASITSESTVMVNHWVSEECQNNFTELA